jgi:tRNA pseudouridine55 synthase
MILTKNSINKFEEWLTAARETGAMLLIDKDLDWTSFDVVAKLRNLLKIKKIGHAGTLDPLASGLLIVCCGKFTKKINEFQGLDKIYSAKIKLGATTETDDSEKPEENIKDISSVSESDIDNVCRTFEGEILQTPPKYSAKKVNGKRLYKLARKGIDVDIKPVKVFVEYIKVSNIGLPYFEAEIKCSKGTYIRALARDIGDKLNTGAYLAALRRTSIGDFSVENALTISEIEQLVLNIDDNPIGENESF